MNTVSNAVKPFAQASYARGFIHLFLSLFGYALTLACIYTGYQLGWWWLYVPACILGSLFMIKIFTIQHDCGHGSFLPSASMNTWIGRLMSILTTMPYAAWRNEHNDHHSHVVDIDLLQHGDIPLLTIRQYENLSKMKKLGYRIFRHPVFLLLVAPFLYFFIKSKFPAIRDRENILSVLYTNIFVALVYGSLWWLFGFWTLVFVLVPTLYLGGIIGVALFYLQHDYPDATWHPTPEWDHETASLEGSSLIILPQPLEWFTHSIGYHHIHHLNSKIPGYKLQECYEKTPETRTVQPLTIAEVVAAFRLRLWSEKERRLVGFSDYLHRHEALATQEIQ